MNAAQGDRRAGGKSAMGGWGNGWDAACDGDAACASAVEQMDGSDGVDDEEEEDGEEWWEDEDDGADRDLATSSFWVDSF